MSKIPAYAASSAKSPLAPFTIERRELGENDVLLDILYCGICHSDVHQVRDEWAQGIFPMVPGHEIVARVERMGPDAKRFEVGQLAGVGCFVDSCRACEWCRRGYEQFCERGVAFTYNGTEMDRKTPTYGGYSRKIVVDERYLLKVPARLTPAAVAPLLCAGITTFSPLRQWGCKEGDRVAVAGLGGLGHMAVKFASSMGAHVTVLSTSRAKEADARRMGASAFEITKETATLERLKDSFNLLVDTVSAPHDYDRYLAMLRPYGTMVLLGLPTETRPVSPASLIMGNKRLVGSAIGGLAETQQMLDYCGAKGIVSDVEVIPIQQVNGAYERMLGGDVRYRFVIDLATLE